jgi:hypothetical protein
MGSCVNHLSVSSTVEVLMDMDSPSPREKLIDLAAQQL